VCNKGILLRHLIQGHLFNGTPLMLLRDFLAGVEAEEFLKALEQLVV
jgi:hypothetical protein